MERGGDEAHRKFDAVDLFASWVLLRCVLSRAAGKVDRRPGLVFVRWNEQITAYAADCRTRGMALDRASVTRRGLYAKPYARRAVITTGKSRSGTELIELSYALADQYGLPVPLET